MELASTSLNSYNAFPVRLLLCTSRNFTPLLSISRPSIQGNLRYDTVRLQCSSTGAIVSNTTAITSDSSEEHTEYNAHVDPMGKDAPSASTSNEEEQDDSNMNRICDKLINIFLVDKPTPSDWRKLLSFSRDWSYIRSHFYQRCQEQVDNESDPGMKHKLLRLSRKLKEIDDDVQRHNELLDAVKKSSSEVGEIVGRRRKDFTNEFFAHLQILADSYYDDPTEQDALVKLYNMCLAAVQAYDTLTESIEAINAAELKLQDIINSPSLDAACRKIDNLAARNELDSALALMITKAWSAAKESNMTSDEAKDVLYHLYTKSVSNFQSLVSKEVVILKYLLAIKDPKERMNALNDAFTPGEEPEEEDTDFVYTTPEKLHAFIMTVTGAYAFSREGTLLREAKDFMSPDIVQKLEELRELIENNFM